MPMVSPMRWVAALLLVSVPGWPACAHARQQSANGYNQLIQRANRAAMAGDFRTAIASWQASIPLDRSPDRKCRGASQRVSIKAAQDTQAMLRQGKLRRADAWTWFNNHQTELWMPNACNAN